MTWAKTEETILSRQMHKQGMASHRTLSSKEAHRASSWMFTPLKWNLRGAVIINTSPAPTVHIKRAHSHDFN